MSEKAKVALKAGMVMTAVHESMCGVTLERNQTYLLTGTCDTKHTSYEYIIGQFNLFYIIPIIKLMYSNYMIRKAIAQILCYRYESIFNIHLLFILVCIFFGRFVSLQAQISLCSYIHPWRNVTPRQRKGFRMLYKQGCPCRVSFSLFEYISFNNYV